LTNKVFQYAVFINATRHPGSLSERLFSGASDIGFVGISASLEVVPGDYVWIGMQCISTPVPTTINKQANLTLTAGL